MTQEQIHELYIASLLVREIPYLFRLADWFVNYDYYMLHKNKVYNMVCRLSQCLTHTQFPKGYEEYYKLILKHRMDELEKYYKGL